MPTGQIQISGWQGSNGRVLSLSVTQISQNPVSKTSTVQWTATASGGDGSAAKTMLRCVVNNSVVLDLTKTAESNEFPAINGTMTGTVTVQHQSDGNANCTFQIIGYCVEEAQKTEQSMITLDQIFDASTIESAEPKDVGEFCDIVWTPHSQDATFTLVMNFNSWSQTISNIQPHLQNVPFRYQNFMLPAALLNQFGSASTGTMQLALTTYDKNGNPVGSPAVSTMTISIPEPTLKVKLTWTATKVTLRVNCNFPSIDKTLQTPVTKHITIVRTDIQTSEDTTIYDEDIDEYTISEKITDQPTTPELKNYQYTVTASYGAREVTKAPKVHKGGTTRFVSLDESKYYVGMDDNGWKHTGFTATFEDMLGSSFKKLTVDRTSGEVPAGVGFPVQLEGGKSYELTYSIHSGSDDAVVMISFYDENYHCLDIYDDERKIPIGSNIVTPAGTAWGVLVLGRVGAGQTVFSGVRLTEVLDPENETINWELETGNLGLDTPDQKYISRIQMRIDYDGRLRVWISYDNDETYKKVHDSESTTMKSITIPITVKRCDHFRLRLRGSGQAKLYSIGYTVDDGGARC